MNKSKIEYEPPQLFKDVVLTKQNISFQIQIHATTKISKPTYFPNLIKGTLYS